jgi:hypothetical protein
MARCWNYDGVGELISPRRTVRGTTCILMVPRALPSIDSGGVYSRLYYRSASKTRKARRIKNFQQDVALNTDLYKLALQYA